MTVRVLRIDRHLQSTLARVRSRADLSVCATKEHVWLRIENQDAELDTELNSLPGICFSVLDDGQLIERGQRVPRGYLPQSDWVRLADWMKTRIDSAALGALPPEPVTLRMVASSAAQISNVLLTSCEQWLNYAAAAPQVRLKQLAFAQSDDRRVVIRGTPLPPISGVHYFETGGVAAVAGWTWSPALAANVVARSLPISGDDLALLHADGSWERIRGDQFVMATRAAVRLSAQEFAS